MKQCGGACVCAASVCGGAFRGPCAQLFYAKCVGPITRTQTRLHVMWRDGEGEQV